MDLYQEIILQHSKFPKNFKKLDDYNFFSEGYNPLCGDKITIYVSEKEKKVKDVSFEGSGCAISIASASILSEILKEKSVDKSKNIYDSFLNLINHNQSNFSDLTEKEISMLNAFSEISKFPMRTKCATLSWNTFNAALKNIKNFNTESLK